MVLDLPVEVEEDHEVERDLEEELQHELDALLEVDVEHEVDEVSFELFTNSFLNDMPMHSEIARMQMFFSMKSFLHPTLISMFFISLAFFSMKSFLQ